VIFRSAGDCLAVIDLALTTKELAPVNAMALGRPAGLATGRHAATLRGDRRLEMYDSHTRLSSPFSAKNRTPMPARPLRSTTTRTGTQWTSITFPGNSIRTFKS